MPTVPLIDFESERRDERLLSEAVFGIKPNPHLLYESVKHGAAGERRGTHATKNRALVRGGGKKPWRQKGTGRARVGSSRNPLWRKGGTVFGPMPRDYSFSMPGKALRGALRSALSLKVSEGSLRVINDFAVAAPSAKQLRAKLDGLGVKSSILLVDVKPSRELLLSARNLQGVEVSSADRLTTRALLAAREVLFSDGAVSFIEERLQS
jgi:large subunit ribosomal protein L4